jgi:hypothetical protein
MSRVAQDLSAKVESESEKESDVVIVKKEEVQSLSSGSSSSSPSSSPTTSPAPPIPAETIYPGRPLQVVGTTDNKVTQILVLTLFCLIYHFSRQKKKKKIYLEKKICTCAEFRLW